VELFSLIVRPIKTSSAADSTDCRAKSAGAIACAAAGQAASRLVQFQVEDERGGIAREGVKA
jgi:hypothetical protein